MKETTIGVISSAKILFRSRSVSPESEEEDLYREQLNTSITKVLDAIKGILYAIKEMKRSVYLLGQGEESTSFVKIEEEDRENEDQETEDNGNNNNRNSQDSRALLPSSSASSSPTLTSSTLSRSRSSSGTSNTNLPSPLSTSSNGNNNNTSPSPTNNGNNGILKPFPSHLTIPIKPMRKLSISLPPSSPKGSFLLDDNEVNKEREKILKVINLRKREQEELDKKRRSSIAYPTPPATPSHNNPNPFNSPLISLTLQHSINSNNKGESLHHNTVNSNIDGDSNSPRGYHNTDLTKLSPRSVGQFEKKLLKEQQKYEKKQAKEQEKRLKEEQKKEKIRLKEQEKEKNKEKTKQKHPSKRYLK